VRKERELKRKEQGKGRTFKRWELDLREQREERRYAVRRDGLEALSTPHARKRRQEESLLKRMEENEESRLPQRRGKDVKKKGAVNRRKCRQG